MKTPIQELIERLDVFYGNTKDIGNSTESIELAIKLAQSMLEKEWEEIIDAHIDGQCDYTDGTPLEKAEQYYNDTFNTKER
jgi:hypothetical protein